jgi:hypothetical protein
MDQLFLSIIVTSDLSYIIRSVINRLNLNNQKKSAKHKYYCKRLNELLIIKIKKIFSLFYINSTFTHKDSIKCSNSVIII